MNIKNTNNNFKIVLTVGDESGVGPEIILKALCSDELPENIDFTLVGSKKNLLNTYKQLRALGLKKLANPNSLEIYDPEISFQKIQRSALPIGQLIMDQSTMAGIGNIYRTEILWRQAIHPEIPGKAISRHTFDRIWDDAAYLLAIGVKKNAIVTVDAQLVSTKQSSEKYNIFGTESCPKCKGDVRRLEMDGVRRRVHRRVEGMRCLEDVRCEELERSSGGASEARRERQLEDLQGDLDRLVRVRRRGRVDVVGG